MPKIFLIKNRLHQQQQRLLESQNLLQHKNEDDRLVPPLSPTPPSTGDGSASGTSSPAPALVPATPIRTRTPSPSPKPTPTPTPTPTPAPTQPQAPEPEGSLTAASRACVVARSRSVSPIKVVAAEASASADKHDVAATATSTADVAEEQEQPLSLVARTAPSQQQQPQTASPTQSPIPSRKRFHHRRHYFGQQHFRSDNDDEHVEVSIAKERLSPNALLCNSNICTTLETPAPQSPAALIGEPETKDCNEDSYKSLKQTPKATSPKQKQTEVEQDEERPKPRFISSILGGNKPYGGGIVLTQAQRKEYPVEVVSHSRPVTPSVEESESSSDSDSDGSKLIVDEKPVVPQEKPISLRLRSTPPPLEKRPSPPPPPEPAVRCSVIQRTPQSAVPQPQPPQRLQKQHEVLLPLTVLEHLGPEQQEPINYHVPKRRTTSFDSDEERADALAAKRLERERKLREARRRSAILAARAVLAQARLNPRFVRSLPGILAAAAGHGRASSTGAGQGFQGTAGFGSNGAGASSNQGPTGGAGSPTGFGGALGGGSGSGGAGGGMGGGRDGRSNYGPNSPPSGALPPFYESLKSGNVMNSSSSSANFNGNSNFLIQNAAAAAYLMSAAGNTGTGTGGNNASGHHQLNFSDCASSAGGNNSGGVSSLDTTFVDDEGNNTNYTAHMHNAKIHNSSSSSPSSQNVLHNQYGDNPSAYGIILKDEPDIEYDEAKIDIGAFAQNIIQATMGNPGNFNAAAYEDAIMSDLANSQGPNGTVDPLQFTATLMLSSQTDHLLEQLSDAVDLSSFLQRDCVDDDNSTSPRQDFELVSTPSLTPDSVSITPVDSQNISSGSQLDTFHENLIQQISNISRNQMGNSSHHQQQNGYSGSFERQTHNNNVQHSMVNHQQQPPPSYQHATRDLIQMQQQQQQHQHVAQHHGSYPQQQQQQQQHQHHNPLMPHASLLLPHHQHQQQPQHSQNPYQQHNPYAQSQHLHVQQQQQHQAHNVGNHHLQHPLHHHAHLHHHHHQHNSDNSNLSLPSPNTAAHMHHSISSAASSSSGASTSGLLDGAAAAAAMLDAKPLIQSVSPTHSTGSSNASSTKFTKSCSSVATKSLRSAAAAAAASILPPSPSVAMLHESKVLQQRLGLPPEVQLEFVNGGHGIKNPLAVENTHSGHHRIRSIDCIDDLKKSSPPSNCVQPSVMNDVAEGDGSTKFVCRICLKSFALQRLLNRHMKCHSEIKRYLCTFCGKGFNDTFDLKRHTRTHTGVRPYKCNLCEKSFTQRCSLESHCLKVHSVQHQYAYKERRAKMYVCEECGHTTCEPEVHYIHLKENHPYSPALLKFYDKRHFKFTNSQFANNLLGQLPMPVHN